jgi:hypothetical protein
MHGLSFGAQAPRLKSGMGLVNSGVPICRNQGLPLNSPQLLIPAGMFLVAKTKQFVTTESLMRFQVCQIVAST